MSFGQGCVNSYTADAWSVARIAPEHTANAAAGVLAAGNEGWVEAWHLPGIACVEIELRDAEGRVGLAGSRRSRRGQVLELRSPAFVEMSGLAAVGTASESW